MEEWCYKDLWKITKVECQNWGCTLAERHTQCSSENSRPFRPGGGESVWFPDFLNMFSSLSSEGEFHVPLGRMPPISPCLFSHSASRYVKKKKKKTKRPKFAEQRVLSKHQVWALGGEVGKRGDGVGRQSLWHYSCPESSEFINQVRSGLSGGELWVTVVSCFWCT